MPAQIDIKEVHWLLDIVQCIDVGVIVLDRHYQVEVWNSFMENHSGMQPDEVQGKSLFSLFPEIDESWLRRKVDTVVQLGTRAFSLWEQRPYLVHFKNYQPITGQEDFMYQNVTLLPLSGPTGVVEHICVVIYDVTATATLKKQLNKADQDTTP
ncbi:PAS domain-containing protein [Pseudomonas sp. TTU2014-080ASC]|uniref:PAS domain-containing protein n=1 Tax=Pseudomonas sp. TTU2014-080ASC TaxID=1729724 RepID=UPI0007188259|nr:PAS domain-containing protein [Pseudomonas sp. TTU2014-080ASC]KRW58466.1 diguanylate cyclase [Pseudomonas sp. TTU2014-080ASC]